MRVGNNRVNVRVQSVDDAWRELRCCLHETSWIAFVWTGGSGSSEALRNLARQELEGRGCTLRLVRPPNPAALRATIEELTAPRRPGTCLWLEATTPSTSAGGDGPDPSLLEAWLRLLQRLNRRRERRRLQAVPGGLVLSLPRMSKSKVAANAQMLWDTRSLALEIVEERQDSANQDITEPTWFFDPPPDLARKDRERSQVAEGPIVDALEHLLYRYEKTERWPTSKEAPEAFTRAYVWLLFAYGFARLGCGERARELKVAAEKTLPSNPIHDFLTEAFGARLEQTLEGLSAVGPLPPGSARHYDSLARDERYRVDRLRQASSILEPLAAPDAVLAFQKAMADPRGEEFGRLRGLEDTNVLASEVSQIVQLALDPKTPPDDRLRLLDGVMDCLPALAESVAVRHIEAVTAHIEGAVVPAPGRWLLMEKALTLVGYLNRPEMVPGIVALMKRLMSEDPGEYVQSARILGRSMSSLLQVGLSAEAEELLDRAAGLIKDSSPEAIVAKVHMASGLGALGKTVEATGILEEAKEALLDRSLLLVDRLALTRAMAGAASHLPLRQALEMLSELMEQLPDITDALSTNSHFCLSVIQFMDSLILGYVSLGLHADAGAEEALGSPSP
jgi:hypothetical protein